MEIIPALDLLDGRCVRLYQGDFGRVTEYERDAVELAAAYRAAGARRLHVVDLDGARTGTPRNLDVIGTLARESGLAVQAGGGIRSREMVDAFLGAGAARIVVGSVAVDEPATTLRWLDAAGAEQFVFAFDVKIDDAGDPIAVTHGWRDVSGKHLWALVEHYLAAGARDFLCTDVARDGTLAGPNNELYAECVRRFPEARFIASGGIASGADLPALAATGVSAVVTGRALLDGRLKLEEVGQCSRAG